MWRGNPKAQESYDNLKNSIRNLYPDGLSDQEADEATRNLIGFSKLMLEISCDMERKKQVGKKAPKNTNQV